jgi:PAS domain S-box-containing protein
MHQTIVLTFTIIGIFLLSLATEIQAQTTDKVNSKSVLFLSAYQVDLPVNTLAVRAIQEEFQKISDMNITLYYEYLDINRFGDTGYQQALFDVYTRKYHDKTIDLVIVGTQSMLELWLKHRHAILPNTPVIFYDINTLRYNEIELPKDVTGVVSDVNHAQSVSWFLGARPSIREVIIVHGVGLADQPFLRDVDFAQTDLRGRVQFTDWSQLPLVEMKRRAAILPKTSVILYSLLFEDVTGVKYRPIDALKELTTVSAVPILSGYDQFIGTGTIGGYMYSIEQQARETSRIGLKILRGEAITSIPVQKNRGTHFTFDHRILQRWDIPLSALPPESIVKNRQYSVWELYRIEIIIILIFICALIILSAFLIRLTSHLRKARHSLIELNTNLETQVQERTIELRSANESLSEREAQFHAMFDSHSAVMYLLNPDNGNIIDANQAALAYYGYTRSEFQAMNICKINQMNQIEIEKNLELAKDGQRMYFEFRHCLANGEVSDVEVHTSPIAFKGQKILFNIIHDITERKLVEKTLEEERRRLQKTLGEVRTLRGIVPICAHCKKIRDDKGYWSQVEKYISEHTEAEFSHGICPECVEKFYPEISEKT